MKVIKHFHITMLANYGMSVPSKGAYNREDIIAWGCMATQLVLDINEIKRTINDNKR